MSGHAAGIEDWHRRGRLVICLDNRLLAESLATALAHRGWTIEGVGTTDATALRQVALYTPDVCVVGSALSRGTGMAVAGLIARTAPHTRAVVMGTTIDHAARAEARSAGIAAVISEDHPVSVVDEVLDRVACGETVGEAATVIPLRRPPATPCDEAETGPLAVLTAREREVLTLLADGCSTGAMAEAMGISAATVRSHIQSAFGKLGVHTRLRAVAIYRASRTAADTQAV
jgi:DNA-binding NarL/FixJ family response regulator